MADCAAIVLNEGGGTQGSASQNAVLLGFGSNNQKARISTWRLPIPPSLHIPPLLLSYSNPSRVLFALDGFTGGPGPLSYQDSLHRRLTMPPQTSKRVYFDIFVL